MIGLEFQEDTGIFILSNHCDQVLVLILAACIDWHSEWFGSIACITGAFSHIDWLHNINWCAKTSELYLAGALSEGVECWHCGWLSYISGDCVIGLCAVGAIA